MKLLVINTHFFLRLSQLITYRSKKGIVSKCLSFFPYLYSHETFEQVTLHSDYIQP